MNPGELTPLKLLIRGYEAAGCWLYRYISAIWLLLPMPRGVPGSADRASVTRASGPARFHVRAPGEESDPRSRLSRHPCRTCSAPGYTKSSAGTSELHAQAAPQARGSDMAVRTRHARRGTRHSGRPARGTVIRMPCRHASRSAAGRATRRQPPWARESPGILPSTRRLSGAKIWPGL